MVNSTNFGDQALLLQEVVLGYSIDLGLQPDGSQLHHLLGGWGWSCVPMCLTAIYKRHLVLEQDTLNFIFYHVIITLRQCSQIHCKGFYIYIDSIRLFSSFLIPFRLVFLPLSLNPESNYKKIASITIYNKHKNITKYTHLHW